MPNQFSLSHIGWLRVGAIIAVLFPLAVSASAQTPDRPVARLVSSSGDLRPGSAKNSIVGFTYTPASDPDVTSEERRILELVNSERATRGKAPLVLDARLCHLARNHSRNMARQDFFNHVGRDGLDVAGRARASSIKGWKIIAENIAFNQGFNDPTAFAVERWMASGKHRANILNSEFFATGIGIYVGSDGRVFFTQVFVR